jgi:hypothetical protein
MPTWVEWVATANSPQTFGRPNNGTVFLNRLDKVGATGRRKPALLPHNGTQKNLVQPDQLDQNQAGQTIEEFK